MMHREKTWVRIKSVTAHRKKLNPSACAGTPHNPLQKGSQKTPGKRKGKKGLILRMRRTVSVPSFLILKYFFEYIISLSNNMTKFDTHFTY